MDRDVNFVMKKHVFVMIRYSVLAESKNSWVIGRDVDTEAYKEKLFSEERLTLHQELFFNVTLPSLRKMDNKSTTVFIFTSDELPELYLNNLFDEVSKDNNFKIIKLPRKGLMTGQMHSVLQKELDTFNDDVLYATVRLDDDDALSERFDKELSKYLNNGFVGYAVSFPVGVAGMYEDGEYKSYYQISQPKIALGLSYINSMKKGKKAKQPISIFGLGNHTKVDEKAPLILDVGKPMFLRTVHGQSDAYSKKLKEKVNGGIFLEKGFSFSSF